MATPKKASIRLTEVPDTVTWPDTHYAFIEKIGPFQNTAAPAWQELNQFVPAISEHNKITGYISRYKVGPKIYRAGVTLSQEPVNVPENIKYEKFEGGTYSRFVLTGPYTNLPEASSRVFEIVSKRKLRLRDDYCMENYTNDPKTTPEQQLVTEILIPTA